jgi:hypothetical protein
MENNLCSRAPLGDKTNTCKQGIIVQHPIKYYIVYMCYVRVELILFENQLQLMIKNVRDKGIVSQNLLIMMAHMYLSSS